MPDGKVKCYSYIRWSSEQQAHGTTLERQLRTARDIAAENGLELVELIDKGVSAYKGKNRKTGALGDFIKAVEDKVIPSNSWLVVENLDRLSRENIMQAQGLFIQLLGLGVTVVTGMDRRVYSSATITDNPMDLMYSIMLFARAHEESKTKSKRTYGNALAIVRKHIEGVRSPDGFAYAIESVGNNMWWVDTSEHTVKPHSQYFDIAKEIVQLILRGWGSYRIVGYLNEKYPEPPKKARDSKWSYNLVANFHKRRALFGEKRITIEGVEYILPDYYPALIDEDTFYRLAQIKQEKISKSTATTFVSLITGLDILKCADCGGNMYSATYRQKSLRYICGTGQANRGCRAWSFNASWLEDTVIRLAANNVFRPLDLRMNFDVQERTLRQKLADKQEQLERLVDVVADGNRSEVILRRIAAVEQDVKQIKLDIENTAVQKQVQTNETVEWGAVDERVLDFAQAELREETKFRISNTVTSIRCKQIKQRHVMFIITFINGRSITAHRTKNVLAFDGGAWIKLGDHYGAKVAVNMSDEEILGHIAAEPKVSLYEEVTQSVQAGADEYDPDALLAKHAIPPEEVSGYDGYMYKGLYDVSLEMLEAFERGEEVKELQADIMRIEHLAKWADGVKGAPAIIEDQFQVLKHPSSVRVTRKNIAGVQFIDGVQFKSEVVPAWQRRVLK